MKGPGSGSRSSEIAARRSPAAQPSVRVQDVDLVEAEAGSCEQLGGLLSSEREVSRADLRQAPVEAEAVQPELRVGAGRDDEPDRARRVR